MTLRIEFIPIETLIPYARNSRTHSDAQVAQIAGSIREFGFTNPVLIDEHDGIIAGHGRTIAARKLGMTEVPCIRLTHLSEAQRRAYIIADNKLALNAGWDEQMLALELKSLEEMDFDLALTGFEGDELDALLSGLDDEDSESNDAIDEVPELPVEPITKPGDLWLLGKHRLLCGDSTSIDAVEILMDSNQADLLITDPPYNVAYEGGTGLTIMNDDMSNSDFRQFLRDVYASAHAVMRSGAVFYIWHADSEGLNFRGAADDIGWKVRQCLIWNKNALVLGRQDYHWKHEPCQPAGTMVRTPQGVVPIESLKDGDRVLSYDAYSSVIKGFKHGCKVKTAKRDYEGLMHTISAGGLATKATAEHKFSIRFNPEMANQYCTYLMRRGDWWRVGITTTYNARGFGVKQRMRQELADDAWIIDTYKTQVEAQVGESILAAKYGIPTTHWECDRFTNAQRSAEHVSLIYASLNLNEQRMRAEKLLVDYGRNIGHPLITTESRNDKFSRRVTAQVVSCNIIPGLMQVPVAFNEYRDGKTFAWRTIDNNDFEYFKGAVYSLEVEKYEHYIADGIVTHNCLYGWKDGAAHYWGNDRSQTTVLDFNKPSRNGEHPTMKPVELFVYQIQNSSQRGDKVLDLFGGSGTTLIACEQTHRQAFLMELDPKYCDVIVKRWETMTGKKAVLADQFAGNSCLITA